MPKHQTQHIAALRTQSHTYSNFARALANEVGNHAVNAHARKHQRQPRENAKKNHGKPTGSQRSCEDCFHRLHVVDHFSRIDLFHRAAHRTHDGHWIALRAQHDGNCAHHWHQLLRSLHEGIKKLRLYGRFCVVAGTPLLDVADDADDFGLHVELFEIDALADRIFAGEISARENVVDINHDRCKFIVLRGYESAAQKSNPHGLLETRLDKIKHGLGLVVVVGRLRLALDPE